MGMFYIQRDDVVAGTGMLENVPTGRTWKLHAVHCGLSATSPKCAVELTIGDADVTVFYGEFTAPYDLAAAPLTQGRELPDILLPTDGHIRVDWPDTSNPDEVMRVLLLIED